MAIDSPPLVDFSNADLGYHGKNAVLKGVQMNLHRGEYIGIVGRNGAGKTTLVRTFLGLLRPIAGRVDLAPGLRYGYVPQRDTVDTLFPIPVLDIVLMGRYGRIGLLRRPSRRDREIARECLDHVNIGNLAHRNYPELSGGQRQRVLIARALATEPDLLVLDEPTRGMDLPSEHSLLELIHALNQEDGLAVVLVSHHLGSVADSAQRIAIVAHGRVEEGPTEEMLSAERLSRLFDMPVAAHRVEGRWAIVAGSEA